MARNSPLQLLNAFILLLLMGASPASLADERSLEFGVLPHLSARMLMEQYRPLREFLEQKLEKPVYLVTAPNFKSFFDRTKAGDYDIVLTAPHFVGLAQADADYRPLLVLYPEIQGLIIAKKDGPMKTLDDLRGNTLALPNPKSLVAKKGLDWLAKNGLVINQDFEILASANQDSVGDSIIHGDCIAAMLSNGEFRSIPESIRQHIGIFDVFVEIPGFTIMVNARLTDQQINRIESLILDFAANSPSSQSFFKAINFAGIRKITSEDLDVLHSFDDLTRRLLGLAQ